ncbi:hypothetical protein FACS1894125_2130 [Actinomycetota bacterium]|nr:hypothetical protein FACS1894125_2130 [Actinomycetota bacterium]
MLDNTTEIDVQNRRKFKAPRMSKTLVLLIVGVIAVAGFSLVAYLVTSYDTKMRVEESAKKSFTDAEKVADKCNTTLVGVIEEGQRLLDSKPQTDSELPVKYLQDAISRAQDEVLDIPEPPDDVELKHAIAQNLGCADRDKTFANNIWNAYNQVLQSVQAKSLNDTTRAQGEELKEVVKTPQVYTPPNYSAPVTIAQPAPVAPIVIPAPPVPTCKEEKWVNADGVEFTGCEKPLEGDNTYQWKDWEQALSDGDICVVIDPITGKKTAKMKSEC